MNIHSDYNGFKKVLRQFTHIITKWPSSNETTYFKKITG